MQIGIGYANQADSFESGKKVINEAIKSGEITHPDFVFSFCGGTVDHSEYYRGMRSVLGDDIPIVGGSAVGIITNNAFSYEGYFAAAAVIEDKSLSYCIASAEHIDCDELAAGVNMAEKLNTIDTEKPLILFYDSLKSPATESSPPIMNASSPLIGGIYRIFDETIPILGAGLLGNFNFDFARAFCGMCVGKQCMVGTQLNGDFSIHYCIMHGCTPLDGIYHTITKMDGAVIYEIDRKPAVEIIDNLYGHKQWREQLPVQLLSIGVNHGKKFEPPLECHYVNRIITGVLPEDEGVILFEPDLEEGVEIQFMLRDSCEIVQSARRNTAELLTQVEAAGRRAVFGLYLDCAGRISILSNTDAEEAEEVRYLFNKRKIPFLGFYTGVEIAPLLGISRGLDWTGVLIVFSEDK